MSETLHDRPRCGRPAIFPDIIQLKITAFFCQIEPLPGCNSITLKWAATYFNQNLSLLGHPISISSISRILRMHSLRPHLHKYFLQITDHEFFEKMESIIYLYLNRPQYLFCLDECPGIQALKRLAPSLPLDVDKKRLSEPNHNRKGTTDLYAILDVNTGKVFGRCTQNHQVSNLIQIIKNHVATLPGDATIHYICDNLSNHSCPEFCRVVAELSSVEYPEKELDTKEKRQKWLQKENKRIIIHFTPKHGSWLNMVEIWFGIMGQKCLKYNTFTSVDQLITALNSFILTWNKYFAHPFNWTYDGTELYGKAVRRFIKHIAIENKQMELKFLLSQIELILNMLENYFRHVKMKDWRLLANTIKEKKHYLINIIENSEKPKLKGKAEELFSKMLEVLKNKLSSEKIKGQ